MSLLRRIEKKPANACRAMVPERRRSRPTRLEDLRIRRAPAAPARDTFQDLKSRIHNKLIAELDPKMDVTKTDEVRQDHRRDVRCPADSGEPDPGPG